MAFAGEFRSLRVLFSPDVFHQIMLFLTEDTGYIKSYFFSLKKKERELLVNFFVKRISFDVDYITKFGEVYLSKVSMIHNVTDFSILKDYPSATVIDFKSINLVDLNNLPDNIEEISIHKIFLPEEYTKKTIMEAPYLFIKLPDSLQVIFFVFDNETLTNIVTHVSLVMETDGPLVINYLDKQWKGKIYEPGHIFLTSLVNNKNMSIWY